jgi:G3E family GTPase
MIGRRKIPLTVIGGFLGAGKTTLLNHLLTQNEGRRLAVLVNDFGAINIDSALIARQDGDAIELTSGCVCCSIGDDLSSALIRLIEAPTPPEAIVIEASGVSDPWRIAQVGISEPALTLDSVFVIVDASNLQAQISDPLLHDTLMRQLRAAGMLFINHCDRCDDADLEKLRTWLDSLLPGTPRFECVEAKVPLALLAACGPDVGHAEARRAWRPLCNCACAELTKLDMHSLECARVQHDELFETWSLSSTAVFDARALRALLRAMPRGVLRLKGLLRTDAHGWSELQFAGRHGSLRPANDIGEIDAAAVVAIGLRRQLPHEALNDAVMAARLHEAASG